MEQGMTDKADTRRIQRYLDEADLIALGKQVEICPPAPAWGYEFKWWAFLSNGSGIHREQHTSKRKQNGMRADEGFKFRREELHQPPT